MARHEGVWRPDTCGCVFPIWWDDEEENPVWHPLPYVIDTKEQLIQAWACESHTPPGSPALPAHQAFASNDEHYRVVHDEEHVIKNHMLRYAEETMPRSTLYYQDSHGNNYLRPGAYEWEYDENRVLHYTFGVGTVAHHTAIDAKAGTHGAKVKRVTKQQIDALRQRKRR